MYQSIPIFGSSVCLAQSLEEFIYKYTRITTRSDVLSLKYYGFVFRYYLFFMELMPLLIEILHTAWNYHSTSKWNFLFRSNLKFGNLKENNFERTYLRNPLSRHSRSEPTLKISKLLENWLSILQTIRIFSCRRDICSYMFVTLAVFFFVIASELFNPYWNSGTKIVPPFPEQAQHSGPYNIPLILSQIWYGTEALKVYLLMHRVHICIIRISCAQT